MDPETLKKAKELEQQISIVEAEIEKYNPKNHITWLQMQDHYGNKGPVFSKVNVAVYAKLIEYSKNPLLYDIVNEVNSELRK